jgi:hypothetical protein
MLRRIISSIKVLPRVIYIPSPYFTLSIHLNIAYILL